MIRLELTDEQARIVGKACEFYARVRLGQFMEIVHTCLDPRTEHYLAKRETLEKVLLHARIYTHPDLDTNFGHSYGIGKFDDADRAFDVYQVIRAANGGPEPFSYFDLPKCEKVDGKTNADRIRALTDGELAATLIHYDDGCGMWFGPGGMYENLEDALRNALDWLKKPVEE